MKWIDCVIFPQGELSQRVRRSPAVRWIQDVRQWTRTGWIRYAGVHGSQSGMFEKFRLEGTDQCFSPQLFVIYFQKPILVREGRRQQDQSTVAPIPDHVKLQYYIWVTISRFFIHHLLSTAINFSHIFYLVYFLNISGLHKVATEEFVNHEGLEFIVKFSDLAIYCSYIYLWQWVILHKYSGWIRPQYQGSIGFLNILDVIIRRSICLNYLSLVKGFSQDYVLYWFHNI